MHGLIFETSICYWKDQPDRPGCSPACEASARAHRAHAGTGFRSTSVTFPSPAPREPRSYSEYADRHLRGRTIFWTDQVVWRRSARTHAQREQDARYSVADLFSGQAEPLGCVSGDLSRPRTPGNRFMLDARAATGEANRPPLGEARYPSLFDMPIRRPHVYVRQTSFKYNVMPTFEQSPAKGRGVCETTRRGLLP